MKNLIKNIIIIISVIILAGCDDPAPIELVNNNDEVNIDIINPEPNSFVITGYDSTGITNPIPVKKSVISLSGIKNTIKGKTFYKGYGEAVFFDTTQPVFIQADSLRLIGYKTLKFGKVRFGIDTAKVVPFRLKYRENYTIKDTLLGVKYVIKYGPSILPSINKLPYGKNIKVVFRNKYDKQTELTVKLPEEIIGRINVSGSKDKGNLKINLSWNRGFLGNDEIIVGGILKNRKELIPLFRIKNFRENNFVIPNSFIKKILERDYDAIVFSFIRKIRKSNSTSRLGDIYFASQSIHNIWIVF